jgi:translocation and assembly module TamA
MMRLAGLIALLLTALLATGCAALTGGSGTAAAPASAASAASAPGAEASPAPEGGTLAEAAVQVQIVAPAAIKTLLERYLDLVRLGTFAKGAAVGEFELSRLIDATPAQARDLLETEGYFDAKVAIDRSPASIAGGPERVKVTVTPGMRSRVVRADIQVEGDLAREIDAGDERAVATLATLRKAWPLKAGSLFRNADWSDAKAAALVQLRAAGYASAAWSGTSAEIQPEDHSARLYLVADSGPLFRSGEVEIEGLKLQQRETVTNLATFGPGTPVTESLMLDFQDRLTKSGLFQLSAVTLDTDPAQAGAARIQVRVTELPRHQLTAGVGISANNGPRLTLEHVDRRVFGFAATSRNKLEWARLRQAWDGELSSHTRDDLYRNLVGVTIERLESDTDIVTAQRLRVGRAQETPNIERFYFVEYLRNARRTDTLSTESTATTLNYHWTWRDIDNPLLPTKGYTLALQGAVGRSGGSPTGSAPFARLYARGTGYWPLGRQWYSQARLELGDVVGRSGLVVPDTLAFRAGGDDSVRGYAYRSLGPLVDGAVGSGLVLMTASAEVAHPILASMPSLWGAVFVDVGNAAQTWGELKPALGVGVGVRWRSPVGPLRLDLAYGQDVKRFRLHFSVGIVF